jgi:hypothetical protein
MMGSLQQPILVSTPRAREFEIENEKLSSFSLGRQSTGYLTCTAEGGLIRPTGAIEDLQLGHDRHRPGVMEARSSPLFVRRRAI